MNTAEIAQAIAAAADADDMLIEAGAAIVLAASAEVDLEILHPRDLGCGATYSEQSLLNYLWLDSFDLLPVQAPVTTGPLAMDHSWVVVVAAGHEHLAMDLNAAASLLAGMPVFGPAVVARLEDLEPQLVAQLCHPGIQGIPLSERTADVVVGMESHYLWCDQQANAHVLAKRYMAWAISCRIIRDAGINYED